MSEFDEYIVHGEPSTREKADAWQTAIGLQDVDGLKVSPYLLETARRNIEGDVTIDEARNLIKQYYSTKSNHDKLDEEADTASVNITKIINEPSFAFSIIGLTSIHQRIFDGVFKFAGKIRDCELSKNEWVLGGNQSVSYHPPLLLKEAIEHDLNREKEFNYSGLSIFEVIKHLSQFIADLWQIHPFREGNTRTTAVFLIKYLRSMGIQASNNMFKQYSWYFRNALVRASYKGLNVNPTTEFLELFLRNVILGENNELSNRSMLIGLENKDIKIQSLTNDNSKSQFDTLKCTLEELAVIKAIKDKPQITQTEIAQIINKSVSTVKRITSTLVEKGIITRRNGRRNGWWEVFNIT